MKISLITVTLNSAETLEQTILSVVNQTYDNIEYIIVDGGSTDNTLAVVEKYRSKIDQVISETDTGLYDALNKGIDAATGHVIGFLHSDDFYTSDDVILSYVQTFAETTADAVYSDLYYVDKHDTTKILRKWKSGTYKTNSFINGWMPPHPTFFVKKNIYQQFGKFNLSFRSAADYELMLRFIERYKIKLAYLPYFSVKMRVGGKSNVTLQNRIKANLEDRRAWSVNGLKPRFYTLYLKPFRKILQFL